MNHIQFIQNSKTPRIGSNPRDPIQHRLEAGTLRNRVCAAYRGIIELGDDDVAVGLGEGRDGRWRLVAVLIAADIGCRTGPQVGNHLNWRFLFFGDGLHPVRTSFSNSTLRRHVILDNYAAHKHPKVRQWLDRHPRFTFHFTPTPCSWLNTIEGFFAKLAKRRLNRGVFRCVVGLQAAINRFVAETNHDPKPFTWTADPDKIIAAVR